MARAHPLISAASVSSSAAASADSEGTTTAVTATRSRVAIRGGWRVLDKHGLRLEGADWHPHKLVLSGGRRAAPAACVRLLPYPSAMTCKDRPSAAGGGIVGVTSRLTKPPRSNRAA